jgi:hypothetical protein
MRHTTMHFSGREYVIAADQDIDDLKLQALAAVRDGGAMVTFPLGDDHSLDVLVSAGIALGFHTVEIPDGDEQDLLTSAIQLPDYDHWLIQ